MGSLGIPKVGWLAKLGITPQNREYSFYDTKLDNHIEYAFQALALDESRLSFTPAVWERPAGVKTVLKQCWFPGVHSDIGGGHEDADLSNITLAWMMSQLNGLIDFDEEFLPDEYQDNLDFYNSKGMKPRSWGLGLIQPSTSFIFSLAGKDVRSPGRYHEVDPVTTEPTVVPLEDTNESIHASVRVRYGQPGLGPHDKGPYLPPSLKHLILKDNVKATASGGEAVSGSEPAVVWEMTGKKDGPAMLPEHDIGDFEKRLLRRYPDAWQKVMGSPLTE